MMPAPIRKFARTPRRRIIVAGTVEVMPHNTASSEKPSPASPQLQPISATMAGKAKPSDEKVAAVMMKKRALTSSSVTQARSGAISGALHIVG